MSDPKSRSAETDVVQGMHTVDPATGSIVPAIVPSTTYARDEKYALIDPALSYSRDENPTYDTAEALLTRLEGGVSSLLFSSGMASACAVFKALKPGDHVVVPKVMYWGLRNWLIKFCDRWGIGLEQFDAADPNDLGSKVIAKKTTLVWIETPCNPTWDIIDIRSAAEIAHAAGALLAVDSTVATPVLSQPIELGADIVMHSATKYLNGHGDVVAGALVAAKETDLWVRIAEGRAQEGAILGPFEAWLLQRGMRTLFMRVRQASQTAMMIATHFADHPSLDRVLYPGLSQHPGHKTAKKQMYGGFGGMLSLCVGQNEREALAFVKRCQVFIRATSLGGIESLVEHRYSIEGPDSPIPANLVRLSVGAETAEDLIDDIEQALT
ncbi:MAG: PLP-dependent aspartate aminotransferase family protein [Woeseiaceae bacterium]|nr:PLP-dependent aspartate aminotransferase family protein [Woeseiaceae bacterium]